MFGPFLTHNFFLFQDVKTDRFPVNPKISRLERPDAYMYSIELIFAIESRFDTLFSSSTIVLGEIQQNRSFSGRF